MLTALCYAMLPSLIQPRECREQADYLVQVAGKSNRREEEMEQVLPTQYETFSPKEKHRTLRDFFSFSFFLREFFSLVSKYVHKEKDRRK